MVLLLKCRFRQYGLWERYAELYPNGDLVYTIGSSDFTKDWFFAQVTRSISSSAVDINVFFFFFSKYVSNIVLKIKLNLINCSNLKIVALTYKL